MQQMYENKYMRKTILNQRKEIFPEILNNKTKQNAKKEATNTNKHTKTKKYIPYIYIHTYFETCLDIKYVVDKKKIIIEKAIRMRKGNVSRIY